MLMPSSNTMNPMSPMLPMMMHHPSMMSSASVTHNGSFETSGDLQKSEYMSDLAEHHMPFYGGSYYAETHLRNSGREKNSSISPNSKKRSKPRQSHSKERHGYSRFTSEARSTVIDEDQPPQESGDAKFVPNPITEQQLSLFLKEIEEQSSDSEGKQIVSPMSSIQNWVLFFASVVDGKFYCRVCQSSKAFHSKATLKKHIQYCHAEKPNCPYCGMSIRADNMSRHIKRYCPKSGVKCTKSPILHDSHLKYSSDRSHSVQNGVFQNPMLAASSESIGSATSIVSPQSIPDYSEISRSNHNNGSFSSIMRPVSIIPQSLEEDQLLLYGTMKKMKQDTHDQHSHTEIGSLQRQRECQTTHNLATLSTLAVNDHDSRNSEQHLTSTNLTSPEPQSAIPIMSAWDQPNNIDSSTRLRVTLPSITWANQTNTHNTSTATYQEAESVTVPLNSSLGSLPPLVHLAINSPTNGNNASQSPRVPTD
jgi:hypothetical protein